MILRTLILASALVLACSTAPAQKPPPYGEVSAATRRVAEPYFAAYIARDWQRLAPLLADAGSFEDPTATLVFGVVKRDGKQAVMENFREGYAAIRHMAFNPVRVFFAGEFAIFEGTLDWTLALDEGKEAVTRDMPFITVLRVVDAQVVAHQDFADYTPFLAAARRPANAGDKR